MIFVLNNRKYNTDNMDLITGGYRYSYFGKITDKLWLSKKGNWLFTHNNAIYSWAEELSIEKAKKIILDYDINLYEKLFGELEEA